MLIKAPTGDGAWTLWEAIEGSVTYLGSHQLISIDPDHNFAADDRFPPSDAYHVHCSEPESEKREVRWVSWWRGSSRHLLVTDMPVYLCNDEGGTVEAIR